jgi:GntR family transcriptional regulator
MNSTFVISQSDKRPIYLQIMEQIKQRVAIGDWGPGHAVPSIRQLAVDLEVSVITVKRAYLELEREGVIVTQQGKGSQIASHPALGTRLQEQELDRHLGKAVRLAELLGMEPHELEARLREAQDKRSDLTIDSTKEEV